MAVWVVSFGLIYVFIVYRFMYNAQDRALFDQGRGGPTIELVFVEHGHQGILMPDMMLGFGVAVGGMGVGVRHADDVEDAGGDGSPA